MATAYQSHSRRSASGCSEGGDEPGAVGGLEPLTALDGALCASCESASRPLSERDSSVSDSAEPGNPAPALIATRAL